MLSKLLKANSLILISLRNNHKIVCRLRKFDKHFNLIVYDATIYKKMKSKNRGIKKREEGYECEEIVQDKEIYIRGDSLIYVSEML